MNARLSPVPQAKRIAVTSGCGGAGKTRVALGLAAALARRGRRVCLLDAGGGAARRLGLDAGHDLAQVLAGRCSLAQALLEGPGGLRVLVCPPGLEWLAAPPAALLESFDYLLVDSAGGQDTALASRLAAADFLILLLTPEQAEISDAFALIKAVGPDGCAEGIGVVVNRAADGAEARHLYRRFNAACNRDAGQRLHYLAQLPEGDVVAMVGGAEWQLSAAVTGLAERLESLFEEEPAPLDLVRRAGALVDGAEEPELRALLQSLEARYLARFRRPYRSPLALIEQAGLPASALRLLLGRLQRQVYGEGAEGVVGWLEAQLGQLDSPEFHELLDLLEHMHRQRFGTSLVPARAVMALLERLREELADQRPALGELARRCDALLEAVDELEQG